MQVKERDEGFYKRMISNNSIAERQTLVWDKLTQDDSFN